MKSNVKFSNVSIQYVQDFYSLYDFSNIFKTNTLFVGDEYDGYIAIFRTLAKIDKKYTGNIFISNTNLKDINDKDLSVAFLPKTPLLFENKSILYNLCYPLKIRKIKNYKEIVVNKLSKLLNLTEIFENLNKKVKNLNQEEKKLVVLLRAYIRQPSIILIENLFENMNTSLSRLAEQVLRLLAEDCLVLAIEKNNLHYKDFDIFNSQLNNKN